MRWAGGVGHGYGFVLRGESHFEMKDGSRAGQYGYGLSLGGKTGLRDGDEVFPERDGVEVKFAVGIGLCGLCVLRSSSLEQHSHTGDGAVLWVVGDAADRAEDGGKRGQCGKNCYCK